MKSCVVIGLGRFGTEVARELCRQGCEVLAMDVSADLVNQVANDVTHAVVADGQDKEVLRSLGVREFDCAVVAIGENLAASILITLNLKALGVQQVICKARDEQQKKALELT
jgi:trk system potassium uptake protein TrkA